MRNLAHLWFHCQIFVLIIYRFLLIARLVLVWKTDVFYHSIFFLYTSNFQYFFVILIFYWWLWLWLWLFIRAPHLGRCRGGWTGQSLPHFEGDRKPCLFGIWLGTWRIRICAFLGTKFLTMDFSLVSRHLLIHSIVEISQVENYRRFLGKKGMQ